MTQRAATWFPVSQSADVGRLHPRLALGRSAGSINRPQKENKTRTNTARELGIEAVAREVIDFGEPTSGTGEEGWGRKTVSVARVSILDGFALAEGEPPPQESDRSEPPLPVTAPWKCD